ncbi:MAG: NAD(P)-binding domain-containing protein, partial [Thermoleophilia bacterium]|nr:NAD(P)-binding domain-containing protein [Thermoleophilia bacterium]
MTGASLEPIGWIGCGVMGKSMSGHLLEAGHPVTVYSRTKSRADDLVARGAVWADTPAEVAACANVVFTMVGFPSDVREVVLGEHGTLV